MAAVDNRYSRFVQWAKIIFPLAALGLLSTMFLFSRSLDPSDAIPFADIDVEKIARDQKLTSPKLSGATKDGSAITVDAKSATPDLTNPRRLHLQDVVARIETTDGPSYGIVANDAYYDGTDETLDLTGKVRLSTSTGYTLITDTLSADLATANITASNHVTGTGPAGRLDAGSMTLTKNGTTQVLVFNNGVKLIYDPKE